MKLHLDRQQLTEAIQDYLDNKLISQSKPQVVSALQIKIEPTNYSSTDQIEITTSDFTAKLGEAEAP